MKVGIVGSGFVGATAAFALAMRQAASEIVLVDVNKRRAQAEAADIRHAVPFFHAVDVIAGDYVDLSDSKVVIITAGVGQKPGETRLQLMSKNAAILRQVVPAVIRYAPDAILLVTTNPVDVMTHLAADFVEELGGSRQHVLGSGTTLDTARFRSLLGRHLDVDPQHVHGYVIGEHGDSEVLTWSLVDIGGLPLDVFVKARGIHLDETLRQAIDTDVRRAAYQIIEGKGATYYGIGAALARIVDVIVHDHRAILTVCAPLDHVVGIDDVTVSLPHLVGGDGIIDVLPLTLSEGEHAALFTSARIIRNALDELGGAHA